MQRTVNGHTLEEMFTLLKEPCNYEGANNNDYGGNPYIKIEAFRRRMNEVVGCDHYEESSPVVQLFELDNVSSGKSRVLSVSMVLTILDDNYEPIFSKMGVSGTDLQPVKETGTFKQLDNELESACASAFKSACKRLDIFSLSTRDKEKGKNEQRSQTQRNTAGNEVESYEFYISAPITVKEGNRQKPAYTTLASLNGENVELIFWYNQVKRCEKKFEELIDRSQQVAQKNSKFKVVVYAKKAVYQGNTQYHFQGFVDSKGR